MPTIPWRTLSPTDPDGRYIVMASRLPLQSHRTIPRFVRHTVVVMRQLERTPRLIGYSLRAQLGAKTFWTLSAWDGPESLQAFADARPHVGVISDLRSRMSQTRFTTWSAPASQIPPTWDEATRRLSTKEVSS